MIHKTSTRTLRLFTLGLIIMLTFLWACKEEEVIPSPEPLVPAEITTGNVTIAENTVTLSATIEENDGEVTRAGFEFSEDTDFEEKITVEVTPIQSEIQAIIDVRLETGVSYHFRGFIEADSIIYGNVNSFRFSQYTPTLNAISRSSGQVADTLTVFGRYFLQDQIETHILFSGERINGFNWTDSTASFIVPNVSDIDHSIQISANNQLSETLDFSLLTPVITSINSSAGLDRSTVTIQGEHFSLNPTLNLISVQGLDAPITGSSRNEITFIIPEMSFFGDTPVTLTVGQQSMSRLVEKGLL